MESDRDGGAKRGLAWIREAAACRKLPESVASSARWPRHASRLAALLIGDKGHNGALG